MERNFVIGRVYLRRGPQTNSFLLLSSKNLDETRKAVSFINLKTGESWQTSVTVNKDVYVLSEYDSSMLTNYAPGDYTFIGLFQITGEASVLKFVNSYDAKIMYSINSDDKKPLLKEECYESNDELFL